jgi:hypothetical protein
MPVATSTFSSLNLSSDQIKMTGNVSLSPLFSVQRDSPWAKKEYLLRRGINCCKLHLIIEQIFFRRIRTGKLNFWAQITTKKD